MPILTFKISSAHTNRPYSPAFTGVFNSLNRPEHTESTFRSSYSQTKKVDTPEAAPRYVTTEPHHIHTLVSGSLVLKNACLLAKTSQKPSPGAYEEAQLQEIIIFAVLIDSVLRISGYCGLPWRHFFVILTNMRDLHQFLLLGFTTESSTLHFHASVLCSLLCTAILSIMKHSHCHWVGIYRGGGGGQRCMRPFISWPYIGILHCI